MSFAFLPKGEYKIGQVIEVNGEKMQVVARSLTGKNLEAEYVSGPKIFKRKIIVLTDAPPIVEVSA